MLPTHCYVYLHRDPLTKEIKYVGKGTGGRAWACTWSQIGGPRRGNRSEDHQNWLSSLFDSGFTMGDIAEIIAQGLTNEHAQIIEKKELEKYDKKNLFNLYTIKSLLVLTKDQLSYADILREEGCSYSHIGEVLRVSTMTIYRALNGQTKGYAI